MGAADLLNGLGELVARGAGVDLRIGGERQQQVLGRDVLVAHPAGRLLGALEQVDQRAMPRAGAEEASPVTVGSASSGLVGAPAHALGVGAGAAQHRNHDASLLLEQGEQQVRGSDLGIAARAGKPLRGSEGLLGLDCEAISLHRKSKWLYSRSWRVRPRVFAI